MTTLLPRGSVKNFMDELVGLYEQIDPDLHVYRWRPNQLSENAGLYSTIATSDFAQIDLARWEDTFLFATRIAVATTEDELDRLEEWIDRFRDVVDWEFRNNHIPLNGTCKEAHRLGCRMVAESFNDIPFLAAEFVIRARLDRIVHE